MTLDQIRYFCAVCQYDSVTQAATALNISQPSISAAIKNLETEFKTPLFNRKQKKLILTSAGQQLLNLAVPLLRDADAIAATMHRLGTTSTIIRLGVPPMIGSLILPQLYKALPSLSPHLKLHVIENDGNSLHELLDDGKIDMALLPHTNAFDQSYHTLKVAEFENVCCVHNAHLLANRKNISITELSGHPLALFKNSFFQTERILNAFRAQDLQPNVTLYTEQLSTLQNMISEGTAIGFLFSFLAEQHPNLTGISLSPPMTTTVSLVWHRSLVVTEAIKSLIDYFKQFPV